MFYCEKCRVEKGWPTGMLRSNGRCECCDEPDLCYDVPSRFLPKPKDSTRRVNVVFITADKLRAIAQVETINGAYPGEIRRALIPAARVGDPPPDACTTRRYQHVGKSSDPELHVYEEII